MWGKRAPDALTCSESCGEAAATEPLEGDWLGHLVTIGNSPADVAGGVAVALARLLALETQALPLGGGGRDRAKSTQPHPEDTPE